MAQKDVPSSVAIGVTTAQIRPFNVYCALQDTAEWNSTYRDLVVANGQIESTEQSFLFR